MTYDQAQGKPLEDNGRIGTLICWQDIGGMQQPGVSKKQEERG
jgi:hypothetical protein